LFTERFAVTTNVQKHFTTFPGGEGGKCRPCSCLRASMNMLIHMYVLW